MAKYKGREINDNRLSRSVEYHLAVEQPDIYPKMIITEDGEPKKLEDYDEDIVTDVFEWIESQLDPVCEAIREGLGRFTT